MADPTLGTATLRTQLDTTGLKRGLQIAQTDVERFSTTASARLQAVGSAFTRVGTSLTVGLTVPLAAAGVAIVKAASDAEETASKFATVYRTIGDEGERAANQLAESFGLSSTNARRLLGDTGDLLTGFGFTADSALDLSVQVNELAVDLASFTNFSGGAAGASAALTKALLGERESVKSLGIAIQETDVQARVLLNAQQGLSFETERQARAYATLQIAQEQSKNAIGDFARTSDSFANQLRILQARTNDAAVAFGTILLPAATQAVTQIGVLVDRFGALSEPTQRFILIAGGLAAALGPVAIVTGTIIRNVGTLIATIPRLVSGFAALRGAMIAFRTAALATLGPAGLLIVGVGAVAALAAALIGRGGSGGRDTLVGAVDATQEALDDFNADGVIAGLDRVIEQVDGPVRDSFQTLRDDLVETGEVGEAQATRIRNAFATLDIDTRIAGAQARVAGLQGLVSGSDISASPARDVDAIFRAANLDRSQFRIQNGMILPIAEGILEALDDVQYEAFLRINREWAADTQRITQDAARSAAATADLAAAQAELAALEEERARVVESIASPTGDTSTATPTTPRATLPTGTPPRTAEDIIREVGEAGAALNRLAALSGTPEAQLDAAEGRFRLLEAAITELVTDFPERIGDYYQGLRDRQEAAIREVEGINATRAPILRAEAFDARLASELAEIDLQIAQAAEARARAARVAAQEAAEAAARAPLLRAEAFDELLRADAAEVDAIIERVEAERIVAANRARAAAETAARRAPIERAVAFDEAIAAEVEEIDAIIEQIEEDRIRRLNRAALALRLRFQELAGQDGPGFAGVDVVGGPTAAAASERGAASQAQVVTVARDTLVQLIATGAPLEQVATALGRLKAVAPEAARQFDNLGIAIVDASTPGTGFAATPASAFAGQVFTPPTAPDDVQAMIDAGATVRRELAEGAEATRQAAIETRQEIVQAGLQFATNLASAIKSGSPSGIFSSLTDGIGNLIGIGTATIAGNPFAGALFSLFGGLFAGLLPGANAREQEAQRAAGASVRGAPAIQLTLNVQQSLNVQSLTDPASRAAVDGLLDNTVNRIEAVLTSFGQRLTNLETRTA